MKRAGCWCVAAALGLALGAGEIRAQWKPDAAGLSPHAVEVSARPITQFSKSGAAFTNARLEFRGGLVLTSPSKYFGGWSGLALDGSGNRFVIVSDSGVWMTGEVVYNEQDHPQSIRGARIGGFQTVKGKPLDRARDRDAEAITFAGGTPEKGTAYVAFEQHDRIGVFPIAKGVLGKPSSYLAMPSEASRMRMDGIEGLAVLAGGPNKGALVAFAEHPIRGDKRHRGWIWAGGTPRGFTLSGATGFGITDAASLPDGGVLVLERRFRWLEGLRVRLRHIPAAAIKPGASVTGDILLEADMAQEIDNLEGLAVSRSSTGETVITLISDDNFNRFLQRTLLLQFTLLETQTARATEGAAPQEKIQKK
jgi:hypothetical protein